MVLPAHAGDLLEDLGFTRSDILPRLRQLPLQPFRATYNYTNFGLTAAAAAVATAAGTPWEDLSQTRLYDRLGMSSTSSTFAEFVAQPNKALGHINVDGQWQPTPMQRQPDAQSPAGGVSSNAVDLAKWMQMVLAEGVFDGQEAIATAPLQQATIPHSMSSPPRSPSSRPGFYGLGFNVSIDSSGRTRFSHSGAFLLGSGTALALLPSEDLGIVVLTNGEPIGVAEAIVASFMDLVETGSVAFDWFDLYGNAFKQFRDNDSILAGRDRPAQPIAPPPYNDLTGLYQNDYFGPADVATTSTNGLVMRLGPQAQEFPLQPWDDLTFAYYPTGENAVGISSVMFSRGTDGRVTAMQVEFLNRDGMGTFARESGER